MYCFPSHHTGGGTLNCVLYPHFELPKRKAGGVESRKKTTLRSRQEVPRPGPSALKVLFSSLPLTMPRLTGPEIGGVEEMWYLTPHRTFWVIETLESLTIWLLDHCADISQALLAEG